MCIAKGGGGGQLQQLLALQAIQQQQAAQAAQQGAAASIAEANLDTESSRVAAESRIRKANLSQGFLSSLLGGAGKFGAPSIGYKVLTGQ